MKKHAKLVIVLVSGVLAAALWSLEKTGLQVHLPFGTDGDGAGADLIHYGAMTCSIVVGYLLGTYLVAGGIRLRRGSEGEVKMLNNFLRVVAVIVLVFTVAAVFGVRAKVDATWGAFTGMLMGWSLQAPISGLAAWLLITLLRPFRIGDRVIIHGITGDVERVGFMYTTLNQVGGTVGSEERANRGILIPNNTLWGAVVTNYTQQHSAPYVLDEVVFRITFGSNWDKAEQILLKAARDVTADIVLATGMEPYIRSDMFDYGILMRVRYMTAAVDRPRIVHEITKQVALGFQKCPDVDFCIPFVYSFKKGGGTPRHEAGIPLAPLAPGSDGAQELDFKALRPRRAMREP
ncbi:MAG: mechanosensitive ion channel family protein [Planctomycetota bacterium]|nr:mechanosensitive ion channel family protein [Planctomycetota bacterium]